MSDGYKILRLFETHAHAHHLTAAYYLQQKLLSTTETEVPTRTRHQIWRVQETFAKIYGDPCRSSKMTSHLLRQEDQLSDVK